MGFKAKVRIDHSDDDHITYKEPTMLLLQT